MAAGIALGLAFYGAKAEGLLQDSWAEELFMVGGQIFVAFLKLLVVPLILVSLTCGIASLNDVKTLGRMGGKTLGLYLLATAIAVSIAVTLASLVAPGVGVELEAASNFTPRQPPTVSETLIGMVPSNPLSAMLEGKTLQLIVMAFLLGISLPLSGAAGERVLRFVQDCNQIVIKMMVLVMQIAPYGVFCLTAKVFSEQGLAFMLTLGKYSFCLLLALVVHVALVYCPLVKLAVGLPLLAFFKKSRDFLSLAFSTASSGVTLPVTLDTVENKMGVGHSVSSFTIPLGATVHMDGSAIMQGVATVFIAQVYGVELSLAQLASVVLVATLAAVGTATAPGAALITLAMVLRQVGLPIEGIGLILGIDRILDMARTSVNVLGDVAISLVVAKSEKQLNRAAYLDS